MTATTTRPAPRTLLPQVGRWARDGLVVLALAGGVGAALAGHPGAVPVIAAGYLLAVGAWLAIIDARSHRLPNRLILPSYLVLAALILVHAATTGDWAAAGRAAVAAAATGGVYLALAWWGSMGMGDVKLGVLLGAALGWLGWAAALAGPVLGFVLAALAASALLLRGRGRRAHLAFGPYLIAGAILAVIVRIAIA